MICASGLKSSQVSEFMTLAASLPSRPTNGSTAGRYSGDGIRGMDRQSPSATNARRQYVYKYELFRSDVRPIILGIQTWGMSRPMNDS